MRPLSYTQISQYQACPLCYKLLYLDKLQPKERWYFSFGTVLHACAEYFFRVNVPPPPSLDELLQRYAKEWLSEGYESPEEEARYKAYGKEILTKFWESHYPGFRMPIAVERQFFVDISGIKLGGKIDRVDKLDSGGLSIVDYKSGKELFTADHMENDLQLTLYQLAAEQTWRLPVEKLTLYHLRSNTACTCSPRDSAELDEARQIIQDVAEGITKGKFPATENQFCPCDFPEHCPYHKQKYVSNEEAVKPGAPEILLGMTPQESVERYVALQSQLKELELQLDALKASIIDYCESGNFNRIFGKEAAITYKLIERMGYDEDAVKKLLESGGLWHQVLSFDPAKLKAMLEDFTLDKNLRKQIVALSEVVSAYPRLSVKRLASEE